MSVWVEIHWICKIKFTIRRHAPRERVSWNLIHSFFFLNLIVTLHVSVWVEIKNSCNYSSIWRSRSTWACELKYKMMLKLAKTCKSRSTWACELKLRSFIPMNIYQSSRSTWACELKLSSLCQMIYLKRHAPRERVSWNAILSIMKILYFVTLHVSVWVEIKDVFARNVRHPSRSTWACELKFYSCNVATFFKSSRSTWACELKLRSFIPMNIYQSSRSTWACELKYGDIFMFSNW